MKKNLQEGILGHRILAIAYFTMCLTSRSCNMYFDNLTLISLLVFLIAFGAFVYSCVFRNCITNNARSSRRNAGKNDRNPL
jgi:hypothetical protein